MLFLRGSAVTSAWALKFCTKQHEKRHVISEGVRNNIGMGPPRQHDSAQKNITRLRKRNPTKILVQP
jgi:hypothetical protein